MVLWESILIHAISKQGIVVTIPDASDMEKLFEMDCLPGVTGYPYHSGGREPVRPRMFYAD